MDVQSWVKDSLQNMQDDGFEGARRSLWPVYRKFIEQGRRFQPPGDNIYDFEWDLLVVVDTCRLDLMQEVATEYDFARRIDTHWSVDSTTALWMQRTFEHRDTSDTTYICSNPFSADRLNPTDFAGLREVWRDVWTSPGTVPPTGHHGQHDRIDAGAAVVAYYRPLSSASLSVHPQTRTVEGKRRDEVR